MVMEIMTNRYRGQFLESIKPSPIRAFKTVQRKVVKRSMLAPAENFPEEKLSLTHTSVWYTSSDKAEHVYPFLPFRVGLLMPPGHNVDVNMVKCQGHGDTTLSTTYGCVNETSAFR